MRGMLRAARNASSRLLAATWDEYSSRGGTLGFCKGLLIHVKGTRRGGLTANPAGKQIANYRLGICIHHLPARLHGLTLVLPSVLLIRRSHLGHSIRDGGPWAAVSVC